MKARDWLTPDECEALHKIIVARGASAVALAFAVSASTLNMLAAGYAASSAAVSRTRAAMARESTRTRRRSRASSPCAAARCVMTGPLGSRGEKAQLVAESKRAPLLNVPALERKAYYDACRSPSALWGTPLSSLGAPRRIS